MCNVRKSKLFPYNYLEIYRIPNPVFMGRDVTSSPYLATILGRGQTNITALPSNGI